MQLLMRRPEIDGFISISPPANSYDFTFLAPCPSSGLIVHGSRDTMVPEASVAKLATKLSSQRNIKVSYKKIESADHFYNDQLEDLSDIVGNYLEEAKIERPAPPPPPVEDTASVDA
jgi:hypothetical protein